MKATAVFLLLLSALSSSIALRAETADRPHIVVFLADDLSWADCSIHGSKDARTPNMERLAAAGMTFNRAFVASPSCAPSRAALLTGLYPARNGAEANHAKAKDDVKKLPAIFEELGYHVAAFGKIAHYGHSAHYGFKNTSFEGFHDYRGIPAAVDFLAKRDAADARPVCLFVGTNWPHRPWPKDAGGYDPAKVTVPPGHVDTPLTREFRARYLNSVTKADDDLGTIYDSAQRHLGANTIFLFSSDHGAQWPFGKWNCYEGGIRTPLVVAWPGAVKAGTRSEAMVSWIDILPTLIEAAGGPQPTVGPGAGEIDGRSFLPVLRGELTAHRDRIFTTHSGDRGMNVYPMRSVRDGRWKYIWNLHPEFQYTTHIDRAQGDADEVGYWNSWVRAAQAGDTRAAEVVGRYRQRPADELYDLDADPWEQSNLAAEPAHAGRVKAMHAELSAWMTAAGDERKVFNNPILPGAPEPQPVEKPAARAGSPSPKPHIVFILADDLGSGDLSCYGGTLAPTPNIDRLASEGIRFTQYYAASPIRSPSRAGLLTGQQPARWRITSFLQTRKGNRGCEQADFLDPKATSIPRRLKSVGYSTAHFGKWHLGGGRDVTDAPKFAAYGYDENAGTWESPEPHADITAGNWIWSEKDKVSRWDRTAFFVDKTLDFLRRNKDGGPCFVNLWLDDPHTPWVPRADAPKGDTPANLRPVLAELDRQIGRLLAGLRELAVAEQTLIVFTSDNGPLPTFDAARASSLRGSKLSLYEGGIRVPCIVRWPGYAPAGRVDEATVFAATDFFPTLAAIAGADLPRNVRFDGEDMTGALRGTPVVRKQPLLWEYGRNEEWFKFPKASRDRSPAIAIRDGSWKLLVNPDGSAPELYDMTDDPRETKNLAMEKDEVTQRLRAAALEWRKSLP